MTDANEESLEELAERLLSEQNFKAALSAGAAATVLAAVVYGFFASWLPIAYGFAVVGAGMIVGSAMLFAGRGVEKRFGVAAALYTILAYLLGSIARAALTRFPPANLSELIEQSAANFSLIDLLYLSIAIFAAVYLAKRSLSRREWQALREYELTLKARSH